MKLLILSCLFAFGPGPNSTSQADLGLMVILLPQPLGAEITGGSQTNTFSFLSNNNLFFLLIK